jgi:hypothetical protein
MSPTRMTETLRLHQEMLDRWYAESLRRFESRFREVLNRRVAEAARAPGQSLKAEG